MAYLKSIIGDRGDITHYNLEMLNPTEAHQLLSLIRGHLANTPGDNPEERMQRISLENLQKVLESVGHTSLLHQQLFLHDKD